jgi:predicted negative regulator of RcsB-dependent stress response
MVWSNNVVALVTLVGVILGVAVVVGIVFRSKRQRADTRRASVAPANDADRPR